jgi:hypothetical protein
MAAGLHQISMGYVPEEDRILLKISTTERTECRLWLTRRYVTVLWKALLTSLTKNPAIESDLDPKVRDAILAMQHHDAVQAGNFTQRYDPRRENKPVADRPLLVVGGACHPAADGLTLLKLQTSEGREISVRLNKELLHAFCHLLIRMSVKAEWNLNLLVGGANVFVPEQSSHVH